MRKGMFFLATCAACIGSLCAIPAAARSVDTGAAIARLRRVYTAEIGVREQRGRNDGARVETYLRAVGLGAGHPWCAAFVSWAFREAGVDAVSTAWAPALFPSRRVVHTRGGAGYAWRPGDVFGIYYPSKGRIAHVGFIDGQAGAFYITVEGNTNLAGSREGDGVYRKRRPAKTIYKVSRWLCLSIKDE